MSAGDLELELLELRTRVRRWRLLALILGALLFLVVFIAVVLASVVASASGKGMPRWPNARRAMLEEQQARAAMEEARLAAEVARSQAARAIYAEAEARRSAQGDSGEATELVTPESAADSDAESPAAAEESAP